MPIEFCCVMLINKWIERVLKTIRFEKLKPYDNIVTWICPTDVMHNYLMHDYQISLQVGRLPSALNKEPKASAQIPY